MLFAYPSEALEENWLNAAVVDILRHGMDEIAAGRAAPKWPSCIPQAYRATLQGRPGLRDRLKTVWREFRKLGDLDRGRLKEALESQTDLPTILSNGVVCIQIGEFPEPVRQAITSLFRFLFDLLSEIKTGPFSLRDSQYHKIYQTFKKSKICPFCGLGYFRAPGAPRHDLDHYMLVSKYPFAGADLRNLPPMCSECNSDFKGTADILYNDDGMRRPCSDPYSGPTFGISLANSQPFMGNNINGIRYPRWEIDFQGGLASHAETWDKVFKIRERYERDILDADFLSWLGHFAVWYRTSKGIDLQPDEVASALPEYISNVIQDGWADRAFLKAEVFRMLDAECGHVERGAETRVWLKEVVEYAAVA
ncbi:hypothetical protein N7E02_18310 [Aliirhizobium terrae]|uniref:hypothetical protein n=1 Tax=Terrirhizobium terrae TaxID=2926709 RepID=UPI00257850A8|nr:hypothetical protein [Rhizobium sp. CC-CFT758]WJH42123.1 hypothetical protein N7E02_18310 [Rhizobium sp. CC-CFT758]